jgi:hypothetical protein
MFPVRQELNLCILLRQNLVFKGLTCYQFSFQTWDLSYTYSAYTQQDQVNAFTRNYPQFVVESLHFWSHIGRRVHPSIHSHPPTHTHTHTRARVNK